MCRTCAAHPLFASPPLKTFVAPYHLCYNIAGEIQFAVRRILTMISDELGYQLHERASRGRPLTAAERAQLEAWYAEKDRAEMEQLGMTAPDKDLTGLQAQVDLAAAQVAAIGRRIQRLAAENANLRREVGTLRRQLARQPALQPA
jgi:predicted RNase H-like nuclease (RuvC/YqgF family)